MNLGQNLWSTHTSLITNHITRSSIQHLEQLFQGAEDKHASSLRIFCPCLYSKALNAPFWILMSLARCMRLLTSSLQHLLPSWPVNTISPIHVGKGRQLPSGYILAKKKKNYESGRPIISFVDAPFRPMLKHSGLGDLSTHSGCLP